MPHPALGLPPSDATAGQPPLAARLRSGPARLAGLALKSAIDIDPTLAERYDRVALQRILRDYEQHIEQLARALETGEERFVVMYGEWLVPLYRRRGIRMNDFVTLIRGLEQAALGSVPGAESGQLRRLVGAWVERVRHHRRLPGDHAGSRAVRLIWKGAGLGDDSVV